MKKHMARFRAVAKILFLVSLASGLSGCATRAMKGTPLYEGEYQTPRGPAEDRIALWPLVYYREPATSLLWPIGEYVKNDSIAVRPLFSVHDMNDENKRLVNVLWPIYQHDNADDSGRIIPFFWGDDYFVGFPLYWRFTQKDGCSDLMFPLWWYDSNARGSDLCTLLGLAGYSSYGETKSNRLLPLWYYEHDASETMFLSLPWSQYKNSVGDSWQLAFPLFYNSSDKNSHTFGTLLGGWHSSPDGDGWFIPVLLSAGKYGDHDGDTWLIGGALSHWGHHGDESSSHVLPLYYSSSGPGRSTFLSLPWSSVRESSGDAWQLVPPLYFASQYRGNSLTLSPLYFASHEKGGNGWEFVPPVYFHSNDCENRLTLTPLYSCGGDSRDGSSWNTLLPFYYHEHDRDGSFFATLLGGHRSGTDGDDWLIYPLLTWNSQHGSTNDFWALAPLAHFRSAPEGDSSHIFPLYYRNSASGSFVSLPYSHWASPTATNTLIAPLLSLRNSSPERDDLWLAGGLARISSGAKAGASFLLPLYYGDPRTGLKLSPLYCSWKNGDDKHTLIPPLLSMRTSSPERDDLWLAAGLAKFSSGSKAGSSYVLPLYYSDPQTSLNLSPLYCSWKDADGKTTFIPPLLSSVTRSKDGSKDFSTLLGLAGCEWDAKGTTSHRVLPLYAYSQDNYFYTLLAGRSHGTETNTYFFTPLVGTGDALDETSFWFFPLYNRADSKTTGDCRSRFLWAFSHRKGQTSHSIFFPFYGYDNRGPITKEPPVQTQATTQGSDFLCLPWCWRTDLRTVSAVNKKTAQVAYKDEYSHGAFPLWSYTQETSSVGRLKESGSLLLMLYDTRHEITPQSDAPAGKNDYQRRRVLWHAWHYEKLNGDVSVDCLPGITYDAKADGFRQYSWLWRLYRWQRDAQGHRKLDLLFIPLIRDT